MRPHNEIEDVLKSIGREWPEDDDLLTNRVMSEIADRDSDVSKIVDVGSRRRMSMKILSVAASLTAVMAIWWGFSGGDTLYADVAGVVRRAQTIQSFQFIEQGDKEPD